MDLQALLKSVRKEIGSCSFAESKYGKILGYIDTGVYALNRIISGDIYLGIPNGKVILLGGEHSVGKSLIAAQIAANALKQLYQHIFYFDSEGGALSDFFKRRGCDINSIEHKLVENIEDATVSMLKTYNALANYKKEAANETANFLTILDSFGALVSNKVIVDALEKDRQAGDQGGRAKICNTLMKALIIPTLKSNVSAIVTNHLYDDVNAQHPSKIKTQSGGKGAQYLASITLQITRSLEKNEDKKDETKYLGAYLSCFTVKNRLCRPFVETDVYIDFTKGIRKYDGLVEPAKRFGFIQEPSQGFFVVPSYGDKKMRMGDIIENDDVWKTFLDQFNEVSKKDLQYSSVEQLKLEPELAEEDANKSITEIQTEALNEIDQIVEGEKKTRRGRKPKEEKEEIEKKEETTPAIVT